MNQLDHYTTQNNQRKFPITIVCDEIRTPQNIGMSMRIAEAMGCETFYIHENSPGLENRLVKRTSRSTEKHLPVKTYNNGVHLLEQLKTEGYSVIALEITDKSIEISKPNYQDLEKIAIVIGSERFGIQEEILAQCENSVHINMFGQNSSMNVVTSLGIALYEITRKLTSSTK